MKSSSLCTAIVVAFLSIEPINTSHSHSIEACLLEWIDACEHVWPPGAELLSCIAQSWNHCHLHLHGGGSPEPLALDLTAEQRAALDKAPKELSSIAGQIRRLNAEAVKIIVETKELLMPPTGHVGYSGD